MATRNNVNLLLSGSTGSGNFTGSTSAGFITPTLGAASATSISFSSTSEIIGTGTNDNAASLSVGEFSSSIISFASAVSLTNNTTNSIATISLTAGDWDVWGNIGFTGNSGTKVTSLDVFAASGAGLPVGSSYNVISYGTAGTIAFGQGKISLNVPMVRITLAGTTSINLNARARFSLSTCAAFGGIYARRVR